MLEHPVFERPDTDVTIWRYMDFTKFVAILEHAALFFVRANQFSDPFECSVPRKNYESRARFFEELDVPTAKAEVLREKLTKSHEWIKRRLCINCWHMNDGESAAMWSLYSKTKESIAIRSTYSRLKDCLADRAHVGVVSYIDYERDCFPANNFYYPAVYKRKSYAHECELRAVVDTGEIRLKEDGTVDLDEQPRDRGIWIGVSLEDLITEIRVAPQADLWFEELVRTVTKRYGMAQIVARSSLDSDPSF